MRIGTSNQYDTALEQLFKRQSDLSTQQDRLSTGLRVNRPSDDPIAAAQAERDRMRITRIEVDQRALEIQRSALGSAESALGDATELVRGIRELVIAAGNPGYSAKDRTALAAQMASMREQLFTLANRAGNNGVPLFGGLGSGTAPFSDAATGVVYQATAGQRAAGENQLPGAMNGQAVWMDVRSGNGTFEVGLGTANAGSVWTDTGAVTSPASLTGHTYSIQFSVVGTLTSYDVINTTTATVLSSAQPYVDGVPLQFDGLTLTMRGKPANADTVTVAPSAQTNVFKVMDDAIRSIDNAPGNHKVTQAVTLALAQIDSSLERLLAARSQAGDWLNRADTITSTQEARTLSLEADRSKAEDLDVAKGISDFNKLQTGYQAALQSYAQIQKLSLFNFIN